MTASAPRRLHRPIYLASALFVLLGVVSPAKADVEVRTRVDVVSADKRVHYEMVELIRIGDTEESNVVLVRDTATGDRYILHRLKSYTNRTSTWKISDTKGESLVQASFPLPFTKTTRREAMQEARDNPVLATLPTILTIETNGGTWSNLHTAWDEWAELRKLRHDIRRATSFYILEGIERMRDSVFAQPAAQGFYQLVGRFVVYDTTDKEDAGLQSIRAMPNCDFDRSFGWPCTEGQQKRIRKARESGQMPERY